MNLIYVTEKPVKRARQRRNSIRDKFMDADDTVSEVNDRFEDAVGFRFHEDVRATIINELFHRGRRADPDITVLSAVRRT